VVTDIGLVAVDVPRERNGTFEPKMVRKGQRRLTGADDLIVSLVAKGLTTGEVQAHLAGAEIRLRVLAIRFWIEKTVEMRGDPDPQLSMLSSLSTEDLIPADHPIRRIRVVVDAVLTDLDATFDGMYAAGGRLSVLPETLLKATVSMALYSIRSERGVL
jgi:hypothetical protein